MTLGDTPTAQELVHPQTVQQKNETTTRETKIMPSTFTTIPSNDNQQPPTYAAATTESYGPNSEKTGQTSTSNAGISAGLNQTTMGFIGYNHLTPNPAIVYCPLCAKFSQTVVRKSTSQAAWLWGFLICLCCSPIVAWIPCVLSECKDYNHNCGTCGTALAVVDKDGSVEVAPVVKENIPAGHVYYNQPAYMQTPQFNPQLLLNNPSAIANPSGTLQQHDQQTFYNPQLLQQQHQQHQQQQLQQQQQQLQQQSKQ